MKVTLTGSGFYNDIGKNPAILDNLVTYLAGLKGGNGGQAGVQAASAVVVMPNFNLNDEELQNVVTFLLGLQEQNIPWPKKSFAQKAAGNGYANPAESRSAWAGKNGEELVKLAGCIACHKFDGPESLVGPSLWDVGGRHDKVSIRESILDPDKVVTPGYPAEVMKATLTSAGFYQKISVEGLERIVDYLSDLKGKP
jgi:mono/diheme cytochrome c family protein